MTADHLIDAALRGYTLAGMPRVLALRDRLRTWAPDPVRIVHQTDYSAQLDGGDHVGYAVAEIATKVAIQKAKQTGLAVVGAHNTYFTGLMSYYLEMATAEGLAGVTASNSGGIVAPHGARTPLLGTNPIAFGFPANDEPIIIDFSTSAVVHGDVWLRAMLGEELPADAGIDSRGLPTRDAKAVLSDGAILAWGGYRGSALSMVVQLLGIMAGSPAIPREFHDLGFFILLWNPGLIGSADRFREVAAELVNTIRGAEPVEGGPSVRMPFDRSREARRAALSAGLDIPDHVHQQLIELTRSPITVPR
jgi:LDH2 family malate/lactate/ureidoglycolate dehydrogenase